MFRTAVITTAIALAMGPVTAVSVSAAPAATVTTAQVLLPGGIGDGGPAAEALVNAAGLYRQPSGDLLVRESTAGWRRVDAVTRVISAEGTPPLPSAAALGNAGVGRVWQTDDGFAYVSSTFEETWVILVHPDGQSEEIFRAPLAGSSSNSGAKVLTVRRDRAIVIMRREVQPDVSSSTTTVLRHPDGSEEVLFDRGSTLAASADDGTVFFVSALSGMSEPVIMKAVPGSAPTVVAGLGPANAPDGTPAVSAGISPVQLAVTPAGDRVLYAEGSTDSWFTVRSFAVGGSMTTVARRHQVGATLTQIGTCWTDDSLHTILAEPDRALVACGSVRSYAYDGTQADARGEVVAGINHRPGLPADSPSGTPLSRAFLGRILDSAQRPTDGALALATHHGVYSFAEDGADGRLIRVLDGLHPLESNREPTVDITYGADGTLYAFGQISGADAVGNDRPWRLRALAPCPDPLTCGTPQTIAGGGSSAVGSSAAPTEILLRPGRIVPAPDGQRLYLSQGGSVWLLDPQTGTFTLVAGEGTGSASSTFIADDKPALGTPLSTVKWLGLDPATGDLLIGHNGVHRVDDNGTLRLFTALAGDSYAVDPDGAVYASVESQSRVWRQRPDGSFDVVAGFGVDDSWIGPRVSRARVTGLTGGELLVTSDVSPSAVVHRVQPGAPNFVGAAPQLAATAEHDSTSGKVTLIVTTPAGDPWRVHIRIWPGLSGLAPNRPGWSLQQPLAGDQTLGRYFTRYSPELGPSGSPMGGPYLQPGQKLYVALFAWQGNGSASPVPLIVPVTVPGVPAALTAAAPGSVTQGQSVTLTGRLSRPADGSGIAGEPVTLQARRAGSTDWTPTATAISAPDGGFSATHVPTGHSEYRWVHAPTTAVAAAVSPIVSITVNPLPASPPPPAIAQPAKVSIKAPAKALVGKTFKVTGRAAPAKAGQRVVLQQLVAKKWKKVATGKISASGTYSFKVTPKQAGKGVYRVRKPATAEAKVGTSKSVTVKVGKQQ